MDSFKISEKKEVNVKITIYLCVEVYSVHRLIYPFIVIINITSDY